MPDITSDVQLIMNEIRLVEDPASTPLDDPLDEDHSPADQQQPSSIEHPDDLFGVLGFRLDWPSLSASMVPAGHSRNDCRNRTPRRKGCVPTS